jgi:hypothetical protein
VCTLREARHDKNKQNHKQTHKRRFLKGLCIVDDVAYFGISPWAPRFARDDPKSNNQLAAFDLLNMRLLWRREVCACVCVCVCVS